MREEGRARAARDAGESRADASGGGGDDVAHDQRELNSGSTGSSPSGRTMHLMLVAASRRRWAIMNQKLIVNGLGVLAILTGGVLMGVRGYKAKAGADEPAATPAAKPAGAADALAAGPPASTDAKALPESPYVLDFTMKDIDGTDVDLARYKGKVLVIVNVASKCGFTGQYAGLETLYLVKKDAGLVVLGFPANDFGGQEPGSNEEIKEFCSATYKVTFPMFEKISVKGKEQHPLYRRLAAQAEPVGGDPGWNFTKFVVNREGNVVARFDSRVKPEDSAFQKTIEELLAAG